MKVALIILDGWGLGDLSTPARRNAVADAETPNFDAFAEKGAFGTLTVSGRSVGLPDGQMGNSEVGHLNIGAGRVVYQEYTRINDAIARSDLEWFEDAGSGAVPDPPFDVNPAIERTFEHARDEDGRVHLMGLVSDGGVHSDYRHLFALIEMAADRAVEAVTHAFTDGRDADPHGGLSYLRKLEEVIDAAGTGDVATVSGRYYAMDRDQRWERTKRAYDAIVEREATTRALTAVGAVQSAYERDVTDEFIEPTVVADAPALQDGDAVLFFNFRADRARQLVRMLGDTGADDWRAAGMSVDPPDVAITTMTEYDRTFGLPVAFESIQPSDTLGDVLAASGATQLRIAESEKYAHVTYFLNGGREEEFAGEIRRIIPSPDVATYDETPAMSAPAVTEEAIAVIEANDPDVMVLNYANPDMVGHTGDYDAAVAAVEAVDAQLARLIDAVTEAGGTAIITADHGNADDMGSAESPHTAHTHNDVPVVVVPRLDRNLRDDGIPGDIAPTMLELAGTTPPAAMTGRSLLE